MVGRLSLLLLVLAAVPAATLVARPMVGPAPAAPALRLRGGLGGVDAEKAAAKAAMGLGAIHGTFLALLPEEAAEVAPPHLLAGPRALVPETPTPPRRRTASG